jgi:hypothetical protein
LATTEDAQMMNANLAISAGWIAKSLRSIHPREPLTSIPTPGMRTATSSTMATSSSGNAALRTSSIRVRRATRNPTQPISTNSVWRRKMSNGVPPPENARTLELDSTMPRPMTVSRQVTTITTW